jgi:hypothetical protein
MGHGFRFQSYPDFLPLSPQGWPPNALTPYEYVALRLQENAIAVSAK